MTDRSRFYLHATAALALPMAVFALSSVGTVDSFQSWLLGNGPLTSRNLPHLAAIASAVAIILRSLSAGMSDRFLRWTMGGALAGFAVAVPASLMAGISPLLAAALIAAGATGGWIAAPRG